MNNSQMGPQNITFVKNITSTASNATTTTTGNSSAISSAVASSGSSPHSQNLQILILLPALTVVLMVIMITFIVRLLRRHEIRDLTNASSRKKQRLEQLEREAGTEDYTKWKNRIVKTTKFPALYTGQVVCAICLGAVEKHERIRGLKCGHVFHQPCLDEWFLRRHDQCPLCKEAFYQEVDQAGGPGGGPVAVPVAVALGPAEVGPVGDEAV